MLKFRPSNLTQRNKTSFNFNEQQLVALIEKGLSDNSLRGFLYKRSSTNSKWRLKWFLLFENLLFYFDVNQQECHQQLASSLSHQGAHYHHHHHSSDTSSTTASKLRTSSSKSISSLLIKRSSANIKSTLANETVNNNDTTTLAPSLSSSPAHATTTTTATNTNLNPPAGPRRRASSIGFNHPSETETSAATSKTPTHTPTPACSSCQQLIADSLAGTSNNIARARLLSDPHAACRSTGESSSWSYHCEPETPASRLAASTSRIYCAANKSQRRAQNSSSISGVSSHSLLGHNEQVIGPRGSTTTTAGKTPAGCRLAGSTGNCSSSSVSSSNCNPPTHQVGAGSSSSSGGGGGNHNHNQTTTTNSNKNANYSSLLNRKIGIIFLEGSYCERLVDSPIVDDFQRPAHLATSSQQSLVNNHHSSQHHASPASKTMTMTNGAHNALSHVTGSCRSSAGELDIGDLIRVADSKSAATKLTSGRGAEADEQELLCMFTLKWKKEGSKEFQFRCETETECQTWVHAISNARYSSLLNDKEQLEQKYLHLSQIVESESTAKWQYSRQCDEFQLEIEKLRREICLLKRQENRTNHLRLVLAKSAALVDTLIKSQSNPLAATHQRTTRVDAPALSVEPSHKRRGVSSNRLVDTGPGVAVRARSADPHKFAPPTSGCQAALLQRARSMEQEQAEQELAVRRARRCSQAVGVARAGPACSGVAAAAAAAASQRRRLRLLASSFDVACQPPGTRQPLPRPLSALDQRATPSPPPPPLLPPTSGGDQLVEFYQAQIERAQALKSLIKSADEKTLSVELRSVVEALNKDLLLSDCLLEVENSEELRKIKKVQSFFRGWLCRRRWKQIVQEYIKSPHAESMRKRNNLVFKMVECEEEYVEQLTLLIGAFLRPLKMAASSQRPALDHDELNSIFLNSETLLFLHQIFLKGLTARMESWPTLVLGDLFNMLLPMLTIYQEYVRNHHFSLQVLAECKQREPFSGILRRLEEKPQLNGRTLETFLTYPMHQIPRYIICLHEILAHTPHNHVERKSLYEAQTKLEDLSRQMHDEVSETENIRQNLAIERMIIGGCDILLDINQVFVRQGILMQVVDKEHHAQGHQKSSNHASGQGVKSRLSSLGVYRVSANTSTQLLADEQDTPRGLFQSYFTSGHHHHHQQQQQQHENRTQTKELNRQCFLFTNHLLLCTRSKDGKLRLLEQIGKISLAEVTLIESPVEFIHNQTTSESQLIVDQQQQQQQQLVSALAQKQQRADDLSLAHNKLTPTDGATKRQSTISVGGGGGGKWTLTRKNELAVSTSSARNNRSSSLFSSPLKSPPVIPADPIEPEVTPTHTTKTSSSLRGSIAGYLASKFNNLTSLGQAANSSSTPSSPIASSKARGSQLCGIAAQATGCSSGSETPPAAPATPIKTKTQTIGWSNNCPPTSSTGKFSAGAQAKVSSSCSPFDLTMQAIAAASRDYAGCDFILLLEYNKTSAIGGGAGNTNGPSTATSSAANNNNHNSSSATSDHQNSTLLGQGNSLASTTSNDKNSTAAAANATTNATTTSDQTTLIIHLVAPNLQEKAAWMSDISQCIDNVHFNDLFHGTVNESSTSITVNQSVRTDPRLHKDDIDIKFSRALNSCKLPQIRYASKERLFERLTDLRFLSIDFLNTFLLTYRVFTSAEDVLEALKNVHYSSDRCCGVGVGSICANANRGTQSQRDSFSCSYTNNSSLMNLSQQQNQAVQKSSSQILEDQVVDTTAAAAAAHHDSSPKLSPKVSNELSSSQDRTSILSSRRTSSKKPPAPTEAGGHHHHHQQPLSPSIPPRTSNLSHISSSGYLVDQNNNHLLTPDAHLMQKRRSTISALTPITGSTSSSLVNLAKNSLSKEDDLIIKDQRSITSLERQAQRHELASDGEESLSVGGQRRCSGETARPNVKRDSLSESVAASQASNIDNTDVRQRSLSVCIQTSPAVVKPRNGSLWQTSTSVVNNNLVVPGARQVRASSLSHVPHNSKLEVNVAHNMGLIHQPGNEHWRLSYKKSTLAAAANSRASGAGGAQMTCGSSGNLLAPNSRLSGDTTTIRRKSAADADHIRLEVTLNDEPLPASGNSLSTPPINQADGGGGDEPNDLLLQGEEFVKQLNSSPSDNQLQVNNQQHPNVPPSSPIDMGAERSGQSPAAELVASDGQQSCDDYVAQRELQNKLYSIRGEQKTRRLAAMSPKEPLQSLRTAGLASPSSSSQLSSADEDQLVATSATSAKSSSVSSDGELQLQDAAGGKVKTDSNQPGAVEIKNPPPVTNESRALRKMESFSKRRQQGSLIKEIDLTQSRLIDSDTSADESEAESTDSEANHACDSNNNSHIAEKSPAASNTKESYDKLREGKDTTSSSSRIAESNLDTHKRTDNGDKQTNRNHRESLSEVQRGVVQEDSKEDYIEDEQPEVSRAKQSSQVAAAKTDEVTPKERADLESSSTTPVHENPAANSQETKSSNLSSGTKATASSPFHHTSNSCLNTPRNSFQYTAVESFMNSKAGVVVTSRSPRVSSRRSSTASAASAFAAATAASSNPLLTQPPLPMRQQMNKSPLLNDFTCGSTTSMDPLAAAHCMCSNLHRGSVSSIQPQLRRAGGVGHVVGVAPTHHPSCVHHHQFPSSTNIQSDASSLCNSRASSRLSSCAGLDSFAYHSTQQQQQHPGNGPNRQQPQQMCQHHGGGAGGGSSRASYQSSMTSLGCGHFDSSRYASQANIQSKRNSTAQQNSLMQQNNVRSMATLRVLSVLRHWVSKHSQDFVNDSKLAMMTQDFLQDLIMDNSLLPAEHKAAIQLQQMIQKASYSRSSQIDLDILLAQPARPSPDSIETLSALEIAEGMTYLDHKIFLAIKSEEFLGQAWMKSDKGIKAPHILLITKRFNDVSRLVSSEIIRVPELHRRVSIIEKWTNVAHICRVIHNFNGVLQICAAFTNSSVFRLKKTWDKISKTTKATIDQLQNLVSTDSRFRNMRDAINRCDPPSIPYVGMYLTDLSFIEEGTPNYSPEGLLNFSKMRMIAHVIREIQHLQNGVYKMDLNPRVANYLLDGSRHLQDEELYRCSLAIEPRSSGTKSQIMNNSGANHQDRLSSANQTNAQSNHSKS